MKEYQKEILKMIKLVEKGDTVSIRQRGSAGKRVKVSNSRPLDITHRRLIL